MMTNKGKIISKAIVGYNKNPGIPYPSIHIVPSKVCQESQLNLPYKFVLN